jgi:hypothetical protein
MNQPKSISEWGERKAEFDDTTQTIDDSDELAPIFRELIFKERHLNIITNNLIGGIKKC